MIGKLLFALITILLPSISLAAFTNSSGISFTPPAGDYSVVFLGNIFGVVDGVLAGTGSQMMGVMMSVFNSAVLSLGGIVAIYTLLVGTMNTAHEGEFLGNKWSSIWVPIRTTFGLSLLIPKASGYCLMQIFVMWVVVQGAGAADKIWDAALDYLNRGGVIVSTNWSSVQTLSSQSSALQDGAAYLLAAETCMLGLQKQLEAAQTAYLADTSNTSPCISHQPSAAYELCNASIPDFLASIDFVGVVAAQQASNPSQYSVPLPNFTTASNQIFNKLTGICGTLYWNPVTISNVCVNNGDANDPSSCSYPGNSSSSEMTVTPAEMASSVLSRPMALQQMYSDLTNTAQAIIANNPLITNSANTNANYTTFAAEQYGVPLVAEATYCGQTSSTCTIWGTEPGSTGTGTLLNGTELQSAINDYNTIMSPTLTLMAESQDASQANQARTFISNAESQGWAQAGAYFFNLAALNGMNTQSSSNQVDQDSGLDSNPPSKIPGPSNLLASFQSGSGSSGCNTTISNSNATSLIYLCNLFSNQSAYVYPVTNMLNGYNAISTSGVPAPSTLDPSQATEVDDSSVATAAASTVFGYMSNAVILVLPGQPGSTAPSFPISLNIVIPTPSFSLPGLGFPCVATAFGFCIGGLLEALYNTIIKSMLDMALSVIIEMLNLMIKYVISMPMELLASIFQYAVAFLQQPTSNPIISIALMGQFYIQATFDLMVLIGIGSTIGIPFIGFLLMGAPFILSIVAFVLGIGFSCAYYTPFLPYMIFTFGVISWLMAVIEAMVAAPIVALGVTHPEGEGIIGKGEAGLMILVNIFLRPSMMVVGYISGIAMCYVSVWIINSGFGQIETWVENPSTTSVVGWVSFIADIFCILIYTLLYINVVEKSFSLIYTLPDKILRWIQGGQQEQHGQDIAQWTEQMKNKTSELGNEAAKGFSAMSRTTGEGMGQGAKSIGSKLTGPGDGDDKPGPDIKPGG
jgi:defect in organelle trafficking protein DotA